MNAYGPPLIALLWIVDAVVVLALVLGVGVAGLFLYRAIERHKPAERNPQPSESAENPAGARE